jgi:hypothetical protein
MRKAYNASILGQDLSILTIKNLRDPRKTEEYLNKALEQDDDHDCPAWPRRNQTMKAFTGYSQD